MVEIKSKIFAYIFSKDNYKEPNELIKEFSLFSFSNMSILRQEYLKLSDLKILYFSRRTLKFD